MRARDPPHRARAHLRELLRARDVEARERRDQPVAGAELGHLLAARAVEQELTQALAGPAQPEVGGLVGRLRGDRELLLALLARHRVAHRDAGRRLLPHAADDRQHAAGHHVDGPARVGVLDPVAELHGDSREHRARDVREHRERRVGGRRALLHPEGEAASARERLEQLEVPVGADGDRVEPRRRGQARDAIEQAVGLELAHGGRAVADVDHGARARRIEQRRGGADRRAEIRGAARGRAGERVEHGLDARGAHVAERGLAAEGADGEIGGHDGHAVVLAEVRGDRLDHAPAELEVRAIRRRRDVGDDHEVGALGARALAERLGEPQRQVPVVALVGLVGDLAGVRRARGRLVRRAPCALLALAADQLEPEVRARGEVAAAQADLALLDGRVEPGAHPLGAGPREVDRDRQLLDAGARRPPAHRVAVEARALVADRAEPLRVAHEDAPALAGIDGVDARLVAARRHPLEERGVERRAAVDLRLVRRARLLLPRARSRRRAARCDRRRSAGARPPRARGSGSSPRPSRSPG
ncbi:MAG: hypothetical protein M5U28_02160 [Sandaracinaceae bacterium]|nr:hypothetical protein [Sandaracinaceae bacterium]